MNLSNLTPAQGSVKSCKRIGRGQGSGKGGTSTKGHKGQKARRGNSKKKGFEGGQMPIQRRLPKFGFKNVNRIEYKAINISDLQGLIENKKIISSTDIYTINTQVLNENGLISKSDKVKILGNGQLSHKVKITAHAFSQSAIEQIEKLGGVVEKL